MREIIAWLRQMEELAETAYQEAAGFFADDAGFASFLHGLAEDEALHYHLMGSAALFFEEQGAFPPSSIELDEATRASVETPLRRCVQRVRAGSATRAEILSDLVEAERSEWNHVFVYVLRQCQGRSRAFQRVAAIVDAHGRKVDSWMQGLPEADRAIVADQALPRVWTPRFLIVEDDASLRELFERILSTLGEVVVAVNGEEGLRHAKRGYFDVIVSDQDMPVMTGTKLFRLGKELDPNLSQHFILCTGNATGYIQQFCREEGVQLLKKPVSLAELRGAVIKIVDRGATRGVASN